MKPYQLIAALMAREGLGPLPLAKKMGKPKLQPQIHRYIKGEVLQPDVKTAQPLADYFKLPLEAIYQEKVATEFAKQLQVDVLAPTVPKKRPGTASDKAARGPAGPGAAGDPSSFGELTPREAVLVMLHRQLEAQVGDDAATLHELVEDLTKAPDQVRQSALTMAAMAVTMAIRGPKRVALERAGSTPSRAPLESPSTETTEVDEPTSVRSKP